MPTKVSYRQRAVQSARAAIREIDQEISQTEADCRSRVTALQTERKRFEAIAGATSAPQATATRRRRRTKTNSTEAAGPAAIEKVAQYLADHGTAFQADIGRDLDLNSGTITHALRALCQDNPPRAFLTGRRRRNSSEFAFSGTRDGDGVVAPVAQPAQAPVAQPQATTEEAREPVPA